MRVEGAGRTDAGVHAREQVIAFTYRGRLDRGELHQALSAILPGDIAIGPLRSVAPGFKPRYQARYREYRYLIWNGPRSPLRERYALGIRHPVDVEAMAAAAQAFVGRHDFSAFGGGDKQPIRTLHRVDVRKRGELITVRVVGDAFLRGMVRRIVAALLRVGLGRADVDAVSRALAGQRPAFDGDNAPAHGLTLWKVPMGPPHERSRYQRHGQTRTTEQHLPKGRDEQK